MDGRTNELGRVIEPPLLQNWPYRFVRDNYLILGENMALHTISLAICSDIDYFRFNSSLFMKTDVIGRKNKWLDSSDFRKVSFSCTFVDLNHGFSLNH